MKKVVLAGMAVATGMLVTGCASFNTSDGGNVRKHPVVLPEAYKATYAYKAEPVTGVGTIQKVLFFSWGENGFADQVDSPVNGAVEQAAYYKACKENNVDAILAARYEKEVFAVGFLYKKETCTVKGFPATFTGIEKIPASNLSDYQGLGSATAPEAKKGLAKILPF